MAVFGSFILPESRAACCSAGLSDQLLSSKWKALAGGLVVTAFPVMATARLAWPDPQFFLEDLAELLLLGSAGSRWPDG